MLHEEGVHFSGGGGILFRRRGYFLLRGGILFRRKGYISGMRGFVKRVYTFRVEGVFITVRGRP